MEQECAISKSQEEILSRIVGFYEECEVDNLEYTSEDACHPSPVSFGDVSEVEEVEAGATEPPVVTKSASKSPIKKVSPGRQDSFDGAFESDRSQSPSPLACFDPNVGFLSPNSVRRTSSQNEKQHSCRSVSRRSGRDRDENGSGTVRRSLKVEKGPVSKEGNAGTNERAPEHDEMGAPEPPTESRMETQNPENEATNSDVEQENETRRSLDAEEHAENTDSREREKVGERDDDTVVVGEVAPESVKKSNLEGENQVNQEQHEHEEVHLEQQEPEVEDEQEEEMKANSENENEEEMKADSEHENEEEIKADSEHENEEEMKSDRDHENKEEMKNKAEQEGEHVDEADREPNEAEKEVERQQADQMDEGEEEEVDEQEHTNEAPREQQVDKEQSSQRKEDDLVTDASTESQEVEMDSICLEFSQSHLMFLSQQSLASPNKSFLLPFGCTTTSPTKENCIIITPLGDRITHSHDHAHDESTPAQKARTSPWIAASRRRKENVQETTHSEAVSESTSKAEASSAKASRTPQAPASVRTPPTPASKLDAFDEVGKVGKVLQESTEEQNIACQQQLKLTSIETPATTGAFRTPTLERFDEAKLSDPRSLPARQIVSLLLSAGKASRLGQSEDNTAARKRLKPKQDSRSSYVETKQADTLNKRKRNMATAEDILSSLMSPPVKRVRDFGVAEFSAALTKVGYKLPPFTC